MRRSPWAFVVGIMLGALSLLLSLHPNTSRPYEYAVRHWVGIPVSGLLAVACVLLLAKRSGCYRYTGAAVVALTFIAFVLTIAAERIGASDNAIRMRFSANLRQVAQALERYADEHRGEFPKDLVVVLDDNGVPQFYLGSESYWNFAPYLYYVQGLSKSDPNDWVLFYEDPGNRVSGGMLGYVSGQVEFIPAPEYVRALDRFRAAYEAVRGKAPTVLRYGP